MSGTFYQGYLSAYLLWLGVTNGAVAFLLLHRLTGGGWGDAARPYFRASAMTLPLLAILFLPIVAGMDHLYEWTSAMHGHDLRALYFSRQWFLIRAAFYWLCWLLIAWRAVKLRPPGEAGYPGPLLVLWSVIVTFASFDWGMSLEMHWYSTIYGFSFMNGQALSALSFVIVMAMWKTAGGKDDPRFSADIFHDLGKLLLTFVVLWAYLSFSQYLITWTGNLSEEVPWYIQRSTGPWHLVALLLIFGHFAVPFILLLSRDLKRNALALSLVAAGMLALRWVDMIWLVEPTFTRRFGPQGVNLWLDAALAVLLGIPVLIIFLWRLRATRRQESHESH